MATTKKSNPTGGKASVEQATASPGESREASKEAINQVIDGAAGAPAGMRDAAEDLPEDDEVEQSHKDALLAEDAQSEAEAKLESAEASPDAVDTPSGYALSKTAGIADDVERGEAYAREKSAKRWGYVPADKDAG